jgi:hypothetical protein
MREIQVGRILHQQHQWQDIHALACLLSMRLHQRIKGDIGFIEQSIHCFSIFPALRLGWQRGGGILSHVSRCRHGSPRAAQVFEVRLSKSSFGPPLWVQDFLRFHLSILSECKMWVKDRSLDLGMDSRAPFRFLIGV